MVQLKLTMALSHYDRHIPFFDGTVRLEGIDLTVLEVGESIPLRHGAERHGRMLQRQEFDICEVSLSSYLMAKSRGMPFTAVPVFPRRLFSQSQIWVNVNAGIRAPKDLVGGKSVSTRSRPLSRFWQRAICNPSMACPGAISSGMLPAKKPSPLRPRKA